MGRIPRPLTTTERQLLAREARALADELEADYAPQVQRCIADTADDAYPRRASGSEATGSSSGLTSVEAKVEARGSRHDPAVDAIRLAHQLRMMLHTMPITLVALRGYRPGRPVEQWPCGHVKAGENRKARRCLECGGGSTELLCENDYCLKSERKGRLTPGAQRRRSIALDQDGRELMECSRCNQWRISHGGLTWTGVAADVLALRDGLYVPGGAYTA